MNPYNYEEDSTNKDNFYKEMWENIPDFLKGDIPDFLKGDIPDFLKNSGPNDL